MAEKTSNYQQIVGALFGQKLHKREGMRREVPMKVLFLGMSRTGTLSLKLALERLGYGKAYHMAEFATHPSHIDAWECAITAKYGDGPKLSKADWDQLLSEYQSGGDIPLNEFAEELLEVYPECKVILTNRDIDAFWKSWLRALTPFANKPLYVRVQNYLLDPFGRSPVIKRHAIVNCIMEHKIGNVMDEDKVKAAYHAHYANIRRLVAPERLLEYRIEQGWAPLCKFLGEQIPDDDFPIGNSSKDYENTVDAIRRMDSLKVSAGLALLVGGLWTAWIWSKSS